MASYKSTGANPVFLPAEETDEHKKTIYVDLENPNIINNIDSTFDYIINDWMGFIFNLPITTPIFFDLKQNGKIHSYKATPEKISTIMKCLQSRNFDEIISDNPLYSDTPMNIDQVIHVSGFGIRAYPLKHIKAYENRAGSFFNYLTHTHSVCSIL